VILRSTKQANKLESYSSALMLQVA
jgi:hypothetical protein